MSDWNAPTTSTAYATVLTALKDRDFDAISLGYGTLTNPIEGMIRYVRATDKFQEYLSGVWTDKLLSLAGGGTGSATAANARTALGLGTMAVQAASGVAITGGSISGVAANANIITAGSLGIARFPVSGTWTLTGRLLIAGHETRLDSLGINYRSGGNTTLTDTDGTYQCTGGTVTFPDATTITGRVYCVKRNGTAVTFATTSSQTIDGAAPGLLAALNDKDAVLIQSDGAGYKVIGRTGLSNIKFITFADISGYTGSADVAYSINAALTDYTKAVIVSLTSFGYPIATGASNASPYVKITSNAQITVVNPLGTNFTSPYYARVYIVEYQNIG